MQRGARRSLIDMSITPDTKDWTWVLHERCPECGFDASAVAPDRFPDAVRAAAATFARVLERGEETRRRPDPAVWSPLEYACHVRDVFRRFDARLRLMLTTDDPRFENWDQDATAEQDAYGSQYPQRVRAELLEAGEHLAQGFASVPAGSWARTGRRSDGASFTVVTLGQYLLHDLVHHVWDVTGEPAG
jgi:hypothetical protein